MTTTTTRTRRAPTPATADSPARAALDRAISEKAFQAQWQTVQTGITPRQWYAFTGQPDVIVWTESE